VTGGAKNKRERRSEGERLRVEQRASWMATGSSQFWFAKLTQGLLVNGVKPEHRPSAIVEVAHVACCLPTDVLPAVLSGSKLNHASSAGHDGLVEAILQVGKATWLCLATIARGN